MDFFLRVIACAIGAFIGVFLYNYKRDCKE